MSMEKKRKISDLEHISEEIKSFVLKRVKRAFRHQPQKYHKFLSILKAVKACGNNPQALSRMCLRLQALFSGHPDLVLGINRFLPLPHQVCRSDDIRSAIDFAEAVKLRFSAGVYSQFLGVLNLYRKGCYQDEFMFRRDVCDLLEGHADLQQTFTTFISGHEDPLEAQGLALRNKVKAKLADNPNDYQSFLKVLHQHSDGLITGVELQMSVADLVQNCPLVLGDLASFMQACEDSAKLRRRKVSEPTNVLGQIPAQDMDPPEDTSFNPSYRLRPKSTRTRSTQQVLNETWVTMPRDDGYGHGRSKSKEQRMRELWDDICYEYDMMIHRAKSTATYAQEQLEILSSGGRPCYKVQFSGAYLGCIKSLYRDEDEYVVRLILQDPLHCLPIIISRLRHKEEEWRCAFAKWRAQNPTPRKLKWSDTCLRLLNL